MPIDPELQPVVELANAAGPVDFRSLDVGTLRATVRATALAAGPGEDVRQVTDSEIPGPAGNIPVRVYHPASGDPTGVVAFFHGSGFVIYDIDTHDRECRALANRGQAVVVSVDYRLAPEYPFPAAVEDCVAATYWASGLATDLGLPPGNLALAGDSAGGNLAAVVAQVLRDEGGPTVALQILVYPVTDLRGGTPSYHENGDGYLLTAEHMRFFIDSYTPDPVDRLDGRASPLLARSLAGLPPALVITAQYDPLRDEGEAYAAALARAGVSVTASRYDGAVHGFFQMAAFSSLARQALDECGAAIARAFERPA